MDVVITGVSKSYGNNKVIDNLTVTFPEGNTSAIMGRSGCGKTTLLRLITKLEKADSGSISGNNVKMSAVFQDDVLIDTFTPLKNISFAVGSSATTQEITEHLSALGLSDSISQPCSELSGGMRRRVAIARAILAKPELLLLDEPFKGLDEETKDSVISYVREHTKGTTVIFVTHDASEIDQLGATLKEIPFK